MKLHLPKLLLAALLGCSMAYAYSDGETITVQDGDNITISGGYGNAATMLPNVALTQTGGEITFVGWTVASGTTIINQSGDENTKLTVQMSRAETGSEIIYNQRGSGKMNIMPMAQEMFFSHQGKHIINQTGDGEITINGTSSGMADAELIKLPPSF